MENLHHKCPCCGSDNDKFLYKLSYGNVYKCADCKTAYTVFKGLDVTKSNETFNTTDFLKTRLYDQYRLRKIARKRLGLLNKFINGGDILEFGSSTGEFLYEAAKKNYKVSCVDLYPVVLNINKINNLQEIIKSDASFFTVKQTYDAIVAFHVIEHLTNPGGFLLNCSRALRPHGLMFLEAPNFSSLTRKIGGKRWEMFYDYHTCHFDKGSLGALLRKHNYEILFARTIDESVRYITPLYNPVRNVVWAALKRIKNKNNILDTLDANNVTPLINKEDEERILNSPKAMIYRFESNLIDGISKIFFPVSMFLNIYGLGSYIQIIARKD